MKLGIFQRWPGRLLAALVVTSTLFIMGVAAHAETPAGSSAMTQTDINAMTDQTARDSAQWSLNKAKEWQTQPDGIERHTDLNAQGKERLFFTPQKLTAANCLAGRHWELIPPGGVAGCVCDGDLTHKAVSNNNPAACVVTLTGTVCVGTTLMNTFSNGTQTVNAYNSPVCGYVEPPPPPPPVVVPPPPPPPPPAPVITYGTENQTLACVAGQTGAGVLQTRQITYTNGIPTAYGPWNTVSVDCNSLPPPPPVDPVVTGYTFFPNPCWPAPIYSVQVLQSQLAASGLYISYDAAWAASVAYADTGACVGGG